MNTDDTNLLHADLVDIEAAIGRIADTLDDYLEMSLTIQDMTLGLRASDPAFGEAMQPLIDVAARIRERRS